FLERHAVRESMAVVPVCDALAAIAEAHGSAHTQVLSDVSLLTSPDGGGAADLCGELGVPAGTPIVLYVGNLERYQGVDLLLHACKEAAAAHASAALAVIGGAERDLVHYRALSDALGLNGRAFFIGPRPMKRLGSYLAAADVLASPRVQGNNTPMKLYSYLH